MLDIRTAFDGNGKDSTIRAVFYIVLTIFTDLKLERIIGYRYTQFADLNLEITESLIFEYYLHVSFALFLFLLLFSFASKAIKSRNINHS